MKKDGEYFWLEVTGLNAGEECAFQYLVDESVYVADPYADKILDPDDQYIPTEAYPDLKTFPAKALKEPWYFNRAAVLQTAQEEYEWQTLDFEKPEKKNLVIYELLVRDFFASSERNYQNLIDTLSYLKRLGINAIELMPITEFNGNESWGYNPAFMFAPDKYYGTKNKLKEFIDRCHAEGLAVILDVVMNQQDIPNPYVLMYYDFNTGKPTADNPWFNQEATHPFNVFFDLNHESAYTQQYLDTVNYYWLHNYKFDGYRFDLSKGFTQKNAGGSVLAWGQYDASRIALLKRMADKIWSHTPDAYVILEHFADNAEEKELAEYRMSEGKGMMLWGNYNGAYSQNASGNAGADISTVYHSNRNWTVPHLIGYMESHDEERLMYRNLQTGRSAGSYNVKTFSTALDRMKAASLMLLTIPGPKMLWQFGELGYDQSINRCEDGSINEGCRVSPKPIKWDYREDEGRYDLYSHIAELLELRNTYKVFTEGIATIQSGTSFVKQISLKNSPYTTSPADANQMNVHVVANFDVIAKGATIEFQHPGAWFDYYSGEAISVSGTSHNLTLRPGEYKLYTDYALKEPVTNVLSENHDNEINLYPNPIENELFTDEGSVRSLTIYTAEGKQVAVLKRSETSWDLSGLPNGLYIVKVECRRGVKHAKIIKR
jgi:glycosidase